jgi:Transcriptional regulators
VSPEARLVRVKRLRLADSKPMAMEVLHVPESLVPGLTRADFQDHSFYELLRERYDIVIASGTQTIEPTVTSEEESEVLGVPLHTPAFLLSGRPSPSQGGSSSSSAPSIAATAIAWSPTSFRSGAATGAPPAPRRPGW